MNQCEETEEGVHPSETPLCGQHDNQTKAQRKPDFSEYLFSHPLKRVATADGDSVLSSDSWKKQKMSPPTTQELGVGSSAGMETMSTYLPTAVYTGPAPRLGGPYCPLPPPPRSWLDFSEYLFSHPLKDVTTSDGDSDQSPTCRISQGSPTSSESSCVSNQSKRSTDRDFDFKKNQLDSLLKSIEEAADDGDSVLSSYSGEEEKDELPITQELVVGSNAGMETKSTPVHLQLSSLHKLQLILSLQQETNDE